jgi:two-component system chemotaxis response regulator CheY
MPVMNGMEFIIELKKDSTFKDTPVIIVSTEGSQKKIDEFKARGATGYITKPFTPETIRETMIDILGEMHDGELDEDDEELDF